MAFYVGGDTTELEYDFYTKTANSVVDCPLKIYKGEVDPSALPVPTDASWQEITSQSVIDKLKEQNEITTSNLATDKSTIMWGNKTLTKTSTIKVVDDFVGKVSGSTVENPNIRKYVSGGSTSILAPSDFVNESSTTGYNQLKVLDGTLSNLTTNVNGQIPQSLFSFNLIEIFERKFGTIPKETLSEKIEWISKNINRLLCRWWGYGSCPSGNKALLTVFITKTNSWSSATIINNTSNILELIKIVYSSSIKDVVDTNGFVHFLAYTDTSNGTIASTIYTDYVSIELTLKEPENLITATNTNQDIVTDFSGKVRGSVVENANIMKYVTAATTITDPSAFTGEVDANAYTSISTLNGVLGSTTRAVSGEIAQQLFSLNIVSAIEKHLGQPIPAVDKVQWCNDNLSKMTFDWYGYGSCPSGNKAKINYWNNINQSYPYERSHLNSSVANLNIAHTDMGKVIDSTGYVHFLAYTDPSNGTTASTIYTDYVRLTIKLKYIPTYDFYTDNNTRRDAGLTNIVLVKRSIGDMTSDFSGKIANSVVENPNKIGATYNTIILSPSNFTGDVSQTAYNKVTSINNDCASLSISTTGNIPQQLFSFDLIAIAEKQLGTLIPGTDTASKVQWLKDNLNTIKCDWYGYGSCPSGNKAYLDFYTSSWFYNTNGTKDSKSTTVSTVNNIAITVTSSISSSIQSDGFMHFLAYTDASNGTVTSTINTDYVKLTLTFKNDTMGYEFFTNNSSEISITTNNKASTFLLECDLTPIATALYGGSNSALKSALKSIEANVWALGSGANVNQLGYGYTTRYWVNGGNAWATGWETNTTSSSSSISLKNIFINTQSSCSWYMTTTNKYYIIVYSNYKSDGVIPSEVNLDYVNIKVKLTRTPDVIAPIPREFPEEWSIQIKDISFSFDSQIDGISSNFLIMPEKDSTNRFILAYNRSIKKIEFNLGISGSYITLKSEVLDFNKYTCFNILIVKSKTSKTMYILQNGGQVKKVTGADNRVLTGLLNIYVGSHSNGKSQTDGLLDRVYLFQGKIFTDEEAEVLLRGRNTIIEKENDTHLNELAAMFKNPNLIPLFNDSRWIKHANTTVSSDGKTLTLNATATWQHSYIEIPIFPNNQYEVKIGEITDGGGLLIADEYCNNVLIKANTFYKGGTSPTSFITQSKANKLRVKVTSNYTGTFTFSNIELRRLD